MHKCRWISLRNLRSCIPILLCKFHKATPSGATFWCIFYRHVFICIPFIHICLFEDLFLFEIEVWHILCKHIFWCTYLNARLTDTSLFAFYVITSLDGIYRRKIFTDTYLHGYLTYRLVFIFMLYLHFMQTHVLMHYLHARL
jgi:hypothetical protein